MDYRLKWLSEIISNLLGIFDQKYSDALIDEHKEQFMSLFNDEIINFSKNNKQLLFIWRTFYDKLVEETITVLEEGKIKINVFLPLIIFNVNFILLHTVLPPTPPPEPTRRKGKGKGKSI